ncbi:MAG: AMP-dependent synthetase/ligase [Heteroscytonema crispum UTEX LB 1556]
MVFTKLLFVGWWLVVDGEGARPFTNYAPTNYQLTTTNYQLPTTNYQLTTNNLKITINEGESFKLFFCKMLCGDKTYRAPPNSGEVLLGQTLPSFLDKACVHRNLHAFNQWTKSGWQSLSNQAFCSATEELALGLLDLQLKKGDRIALLMHSDVSFCIADMGSLLAGLVNVPIDLSQTLEHIIFILRHTEAKTLIVSNLDLLYQVVPYLWNTPDLQTVIVADVTADWQQMRQQLTYQLNGGEHTHTEEILETACLYIPEFSSQTRLEEPFPEFPQCIQLFSLSEIRDRGQTKISESRLQQLRESLSANDLATIIYIPGSSGEPQGVMLTHENLSANALAMFTGIPNLEFGEKEVFLSFLPLTHVFARVLLYGHINYGHSIYFTTPNRVIKHLKQVQPTIFATVPLFLEKVYSKILEEGIRATGVEDGCGATGVETSKTWKNFFLSPYLPIPPSPHLPLLRWVVNIAKRYELGQVPRGRYRLMLRLADRLVFSQWRSLFGGKIKYLICGGAALKAEVANLFGAAGITILQGYGLTETSSGVTCNRGKFNRAGTVGVPIPGVEIAIACDNEILVKGPYITPGYYKNPDATQELIDADGWLHTGDLGEFTQDGFLKITGLKKSRFKLSTGKYVTPQPLESKLEKSPLVAKAVTVGAERKFCAMLIFPNLDNLRSWVQMMEIDMSDEALLKHPCIIALYQALVAEANCHLPHWSTIKRFQLINATLTVENGMLTPTQEVKRAVIAEVFAKEIDAMYGDRGDKGDGCPDKEIESINDRCPSIPVASCPTFAQSLNS